MSDRVHELIEALTDDRAIAIVRAERISDPAALCAALAAGGIRAIELTFTTPGVVDLLRSTLAQHPDALVGAGTVTSESQAEAAIAAGAVFLVTPGVQEGVAAIARTAGVPVIMGALTPTEVMRAVDSGAAAVKIFPASTVGPDHVRQLHGPFPDVSFIASGGITELTARAWIEAGALAATAGSGVVSAAAVAASDWAGITSRASAFRAAAIGRA